MARIPAVPEEQAGVLGGLVYRFARRWYGQVPEPFAVAAPPPGLFWAGLVSEMATTKGVDGVAEVGARAGGLPDGDAVVGCPGASTSAPCCSASAGSTSTACRHIDEYATSPLYSADERLAIGYADAMTAQPPTVTDAQVDELERAFGRAGLVELTTQIALENMRARTNHALGITGQGFDAACKVRLGATGTTTGAAASASRG